MSVKGLDKIFKPKSIAVIGASNTKGSVGYMLLHNLIGVGYEGVVYPVNNVRSSVQGIHAYGSISQIPARIDLAIIAVPAMHVPDILEECGVAGVGGVIIISAGFKEIGKEGRKLEERIGKIARSYGIRIIGPNCLGIIMPRFSLNASFAHLMPEHGSVAFISQSGALCTAVLDMCAHRHIGFSAFVSIGSMVDVDFGDLIDYFGMDPATSSIMLYIESLKNVREFMSAARHFAKNKPIIVVKSGRFARSAKAAASHTGALAGDDNFYDAAFKRAGAIRVLEIEDLFDCSAALAVQTRPRGPRLAIITNAGGPGVLAADRLIDKGGVIAELSDETVEALDKVLPPFWSRENPVDILGDATPERYRDAVTYLLSDTNVDGIIVLLTPQAMTDPDGAAKLVSEVASGNMPHYKPLLTSWMGADAVESGRDILERNSIPNFETPEQAVDVYLQMYQYTKNIASLYEAPGDIVRTFTPRREYVKNLFRAVASEKRTTLTETEAKAVLDAYQIPVARMLVAKSADACASLASEIGFPVAVKILSPDVTHKTDVGGVILDVATPEDAVGAFERVVANTKASQPDALITGATVQKMIDRDQGYEIIIGSKFDSLFGPAILFGAGGTAVELFRDLTLGFPPLNQVLARRMIEDTKIYSLLKGFRDKPPANILFIEETLVKISYMLIDFPEIVEMDINPIYVDDKSIIALDARIIIDPKKVGPVIPPGKHLIISRYPTKYQQKWVNKEGIEILLRVIRPEDEKLWIDLVNSFSRETVRYRFFGPQSFDHSMAVRFCNIDYDREIAIAAFVKEDGETRMVGVGRLITEPDEETAEFGEAVTDRWQGRGVGGKLLDMVIEVARDFRLRWIWGEVLSDNSNMLGLCESRGFAIEPEREHGMVRVTLEL